MRAAKCRLAHPPMQYNSYSRGVGRMSKRFGKVFLAVAIPISVTALVTAGTSTLLLAARMQSALHVKAGLWEFDSSGKVTGDTVFRDALLAGVPPTQRAQHLALLRQGISEPNKERICVTQAFFDRAISSLGTGCKQTVLSNTASRIELLTECRVEDHGWKDQSSNRTVVSPTTSIISEHGISTEAGKTMTRDTVQHGRWISSSCGNLQPFRVR